MKIYFYLFLLLLHQITLSLSSSCLGSSTIVIVTPQDQTWNVDSLDWNTTPEQKPNLILFTHSKTDVVCAVKTALNLNVTLSIRAGRHSYEAFSNSNGSAVIDVSNLTSIHVQKSRKFVDVGAGVRLWDLYSNLDKEQLAFPGGSCITVGVAGFVLGGGYSFFSRNYGMASDNLIEADMVIVNKNGSVSSVTAAPGSALLWALKGAGVGNFGVVTRLRLRVFARPTMVSTVRINFESGATRAAFQLYDKIAPHAVDQLTLQFAFYKNSSSLVGTFIGNQSELIQHAQLNKFEALSHTPASLDSVSWLAALAWLGGCSLHVDCQQKSKAFPDPNTALWFNAVSQYVATPLSQQHGAVSAAIAAARQLTSFGLLMVDAYGGAINRIDPHRSAFNHRNMSYHIQYLYYINSPSTPTNATKWLQTTMSALQPFTPHASYRNYPSILLKNANQRYFGDNLPKLKQIKSQIDPKNIFQYKQSIQ